MAGAAHHIAQSTEDSISSRDEGDRAHKMKQIANLLVIPLPNFGT